MVMRDNPILILSISFNVFIRLMLLFIIFLPIYVLSTYSNYEDTTIALMAFIVSVGFLILL